VKPIPSVEVKHTDGGKPISRYHVEKYPMRELPYTTKSICPDCLLQDGVTNVIDATLYEENEKVMYKKTCETHGEFIEVYWGDVKLWKRAMSYWYKTIGLDNPRTETIKGCPLDCGLCTQHKSHTALALLDVTNRCNIRCPICFALAADKDSSVYEPTPNEVLEMMKNLRNNMPVPTPAIQFAGGEPTVNKHLPQYVRWAKELGFKNVMVATNGIRLSRSKEYFVELVDAGLSTLYLSYDGSTPEPYIVARGYNMQPIKDKVIQNAREIDFQSIIMVPTVIGGVNDHQVGDLVDIAVRNRDVVRCVNFQPVSITGRIDYEKRQEMRITIPDLIHKIEEQTNGRIKPDDWYPVPSMTPFGRALGLMAGHPQVEMGCHAACGMSTFIFINDDGEYEPITHIIDVDRFIELGVEISNLYADGKRAPTKRAKAKLAASIRHIKKKGALKDLFTLLLNKSDYHSLAKFMRRVIMIGSMHFMDAYNMDLERVQHCPINYAIPDGRIIPFCTYNSIHRSKVETKFGMTFDEWRDCHKPTNMEEDTITNPEFDWTKHRE
jgi:uncharacterized radical SAM superfamily Fe-S cluster-containing enzyme